MTDTWQQPASGAAWRNRIVAHEDVPPQDLAAHPLNYRVHTLLQDQLTMRSLEQVGQVKSVVANRATGRILDGHLRVALAIRTGQPTVAVEWLDVAEQDEASVIALLNFTESLAEVNQQRLDDLLSEVRLEDRFLMDELRAWGAEFVKEQPDAPGEFKELGDDLETAYRCPSCGYEWSGRPK